MRTKNQEPAKISMGHLVKRDTCFSRPQAKRVGGAPAIRAESRIAIALTPTVILLAINTRISKLHCNYRYSIIHISLSITRNSASPLPPPVKGVIKACSVSAVT